MNCTKCKQEITVGQVFGGGKENPICEKCLGIHNPWDNPEDYRYYWGGKMVTLDELPPFARKCFPTLDMYK